MLDDKVLVAIIGLAAGAAGSLIAPWINWGIEKRRLQYNSRRELVEKWRTMLADVIRTEEWSDAGELEYLLTQRPEYFSMKVHMNAKVMAVFSSADVTDVDTLAVINKEIHRLERRWGLIWAMSRSLLNRGQ